MYSRVHKSVYAWRPAWPWPGCRFTDLLTNVICKSALAKLPTRFYFSYFMHTAAAKVKFLTHALIDYLVVIRLYIHGCWFFSGNLHTPIETPSFKSLNVQLRWIIHIFIQLNSYDACIFCILYIYSINSIVARVSSNRPLPRVTPFVSLPTTH